MPLEICYKCKQFKHGVTLYADDRICPDCYAKNELALKAIGEERQGKCTTPSRIPTPTNKRGNRKQPSRQAKMAVSKENVSVSNRSPVMTTNRNIAAPTVSHNDNQKSDDTNNGKIEKLEALISSLTFKVNMQADTITQLTNKLQFVLNMIGVTDADNGNDPVIASSSPSNQPSCSKALTGQKCGISLLTEEFVQMKQPTCKTQQKSNSEDKFPTPANEHEKKTSLIVHRTLHDINRRRRNIIISGMTECNDDTKAFLDLCENNLSLKPYITESRRIGKIRPDRPRLLLVKLRTEENAKEILKASRQLKQDPDNRCNTIYINRDLSPEEAQLAYERRQRLRQQKMSTNPEMLNNDKTNTNNNNNNQSTTNDQLHQSIRKAPDSRSFQRNNNST